MIKHSNTTVKDEALIKHANISGKIACILMTFLSLLLLSISPITALADTTSVSTATVTASYRHPNTGEIEDSGGESSETLGQSMVDGLTETEALFEVDNTGTSYVTLRFKLQDQLSDVSFSYDSDGTGSSYVDTEVSLMQVDGEENTGDYRFAVESYDSIIRCSLYPEPMGRYVVFYVTLSDLIDGNSAGFVETVVAGEEISAGAGAGVSMPVIVAIVAVVVVIAAILVIYFAWYKPKQARQNASTSAANASAAKSDPNDSSGQ